MWLKIKQYDDIILNLFFIFWNIIDKKIIMEQIFQSANDH